MNIEGFKISVIVTSFNRKKLLLRTLVAILEQTHRNIEVIVVDNFSDYDFHKLIEEIGDSRIKAYQNSNNGIIAINRNFGSKKASGDYLAFCDDDDVWLKDKLEFQLKVMREDPNILLNGTLARKVGYKTNFGQANFGLMYRNVTLSPFFIARYNPIITSSVLIRKNVFIALRGFSEETNLISVEDVDLWLRVFDMGKISILKQILVNYEIHNSNITQFHLDKRLEHFKRYSLNVNSVESPFEQNTPVILNILKSSVHLVYLIYYQAIKILSRFLFFRPSLIIASNSQR